MREMDFTSLISEKMVIKTRISYS